MSDYINESLLDASPIKKQKEESAKLVAKWDKSGLLEGMDNDWQKSGMAVLLENQARQLISEASKTSPNAGAGVGDEEITDGILLRIDQNKYWFAQAEGDMFSWYKAQAEGLNVNIIEPNVWVSQIQGPLSMQLLKNLIDSKLHEQWKYFDWTEVNIADEKVIISRTGFSNELGWEIYFRPENNIEKLGDLILEEGSKLGMIITATPVFRCRRIEAGLLSAGQDFTKNTTPFSVGLGKFVDLKKALSKNKKELKNLILKSIYLKPKSHEFEINKEKANKNLERTMNVTGG